MIRPVQDWTDNLVDNSYITVNSERAQIALTASDWANGVAEFEHSYTDVNGDL